MKIMKPIFISLGFVFTGIGAVGVVLPVLPTTPFLLLAAFFFAKGSDRMDRWFRSTRIYKNHLESFVTHKAMTLKTKLSILFSASLMLIIAFCILQIKAQNVGNTTSNVIGRILIVSMIPVKYIYFFTRIKTITQEEAERLIENAEVRN